MSHPTILESSSPTAADLAWSDEAACAHSAAALARAPALGDALILLRGDLGAGKSTFTRHLLRALGVTGRIKSPTYAVMEPHEGTDAQGRPLAVSHFDFYRFRDPQEWEDAGFRDVFGAPGLKVCEWPERAEGLLPPADLVLLIGIGSGGQRSVRAVADTVKGRSLLLALCTAAVPPTGSAPRSA